jgi:23S rRNA (cytidine1920-2'-O)/16S rRNA (cytidine1409-2'-O)-methyltransferase
VFVGARVLDAGASTGGFTDCALQHGAREVLAVDVGHNQLHERLLADPRVESLERTNLRTIDPVVLGEPADVVVGDVSFISLTMVLDNLFAASLPGALFLLLVKPQFEAGRTEVSRGRGIITDPAIWHRVLLSISDALIGRNAAIMGVMVSPITGSDGNVEFVAFGRSPGSADPMAGHVALVGEDLIAAIDAVVASVPSAIESPGTPTGAGQ